MIRQLPIASILFAITAGAMAATPTCQFERVQVGEQKLGSWIDKSNWLAVEHQRLTLQSGEMFMPAWHLPQMGNGQNTAVKQGTIDQLQSVDPLDGSRRDLGFMLDSRLYVDGLVVLRNGRVIAERYKNGLLPDKPRLLLDATRPLLNMLGAISISQGKLSSDKAVSRYIPNLATSTGLRKMSIQRLLESEDSFSWAPQEIEAWRRASGWTTNQAVIDIHAWLAEPGRWDKPINEQYSQSFRTSSPDDDLLAWILAASNAAPLSRLFCEQLFARTSPEHGVIWLSDSQGAELATGLGLSLRDFAKLGQVIVEARGSRNRGKIPSWFIETLTASSGIRHTDVKGLAKGSERRYGFIHLGGSPNRVALIGAHGTSLYIDFDKRLVIALYATHPGENAAGMLASLEQVWKTVDQASEDIVKRRNQ